MAKTTGQRAPDLRGDAEGAPLPIGDVDRLGLSAIGKAEQPFDRAITGLQTARHHGPIRVKHPGKLGADCLAKIAHLVKIGQAMPPDPTPQLTSAKFWQARRNDLRLKVRR